MVIAVLGVLLICTVALGYTVRNSAQPPADVDPEAAGKAAVELHRIRRDLEVGLTKSEQRRDLQRLRRIIDHALEASDDEP